jgi:molybdenum cofactor cytidylyltransferase
LDPEPDRGVFTLTPFAAPLLAVVLAAGASRRFGSDKRIALTPAGTSLLQATVSALAGHADAMYIAIRPNDVIDESWPRSSSAATIHYVRAPRADEGMGCSLADAVRQLPQGCDVLVALADMPFIQSETVGKLVRHFRHSMKNAPIVFPQLAGPMSRGHPVIFHHYYRGELEALQGDKGASGLLLAHADALDPLEVRDRGVLADIDQPADLLRN